MLIVQGTDPGVVSRRMHHHGEKLRPLIDTLISSLLLESDLARDNYIHRLYQSRTGAASYGLYLADGREFHFRLGWIGQASYIVVNDAYVNGKEIHAIRNESQARHFMRGLSCKGKVIAA